MLEAKKVVRCLLGQGFVFTHPLADVHAGQRKLFASTSAFLSNTSRASLLLPSAFCKFDTVYEELLLFIGLLPNSAWALAMKSMLIYLCQEAKYFTAQSCWKLFRYSLYETASRST